MKNAIARCTVICAMLLSTTAAPAEFTRTCTWSDGFGLLQARISSSGGFASVAGRFTFLETAVCKNPPCLSEQRQTLLEALVDEQRRVFDRATQSSIFVGQGVFGGRSVSLEITESTSNFKMIFADGSQATFSFGGCFQ
jgi:hypothetical protein